MPSKSKFAKKAGISQSVAQEFHTEDKKKKKKMLDYYAHKRGY